MRKTMIAIVAAASCYAALAAPGPGREYFGRIKDQVQIVTNGYTKAEVDGKVAEAKAEAYPKASGNELAEVMRVISLRVQGEDARAVVTNYDSQTQMPALSLQYKVPDGQDAGTWRLAWNELTRWNWLTGEYLPTNFYNKAEVDAKTDNVPWGFWDSQTGRYSPDNTVQMSADRVILCSGASYQRTVTAKGTYFVWTANDPYEVTGIESNGFFRIEDAEGNVTFEIVKGEKVTAAANPDGMRVETVMGVNHLHIHYPIEADAHPTLEICGDLKTHDWIAETESSCIVNVNWTGTSGNYYAEVWCKGACQGNIFVKGTYKKDSDSYIRYLYALAVQQLKIGNVIYNVGTAQISGYTVPILKQAN